MKYTIDINEYDPNSTIKNQDEGKKYIFHNDYTNYNFLADIKKIEKKHIEKYSMVTQIITQHG
jgi:hypothetical protein